MINDTSKEIEYLIDKYLKQLDEEAQNGWSDAYKKIENFYCRFLNKLFGWKLYNRNYYNKNESYIDLTDFDKNISIQVTAQKQDKKDKISRTLKGFSNKKGYKEIYIAFTNSDFPNNYENKWSELNNIIKEFNISKHIITPETLKATIQDYTIQEQIKILDFLKQEVEPLKYGIKSLNFIQTIDNKFKNDSRFISNNYFFNNNLISLNDKEFIFYRKISKDIYKNRFSKGQHYLIIGNSCSGKTSFSYFTAQNLENKTITKSFYIDIFENISLDKIRPELEILNNNISFLIVDNIHNNPDFCNTLFITLKDYSNINTIFISRTTSFINSFTKESQVYRQNFKETFLYNEISENELSNKFNNIIKRRLKYIQDKNQKLKYNIGEINKVKELVNYNLLKLSILLDLWEKNGGNLDKLNNEDLNHLFFDIYDLKDRAELYLTLQFASVYSYDVPFERLFEISDFEKYAISDKLEKKGLIYKKDNYYHFYHTEFAELLVKAISSDYKLENPKEIYIIKYLSENRLPRNLNILIKKLIEYKRNDIIEKIITNDKIVIKVVEFYSKQDTLYPYNFNIFIKYLSYNKKAFKKFILSKSNLNKILLYYKTLTLKEVNVFLKILEDQSLLSVIIKEYNFITNLNAVLNFEKIRIYEKDGFEFKKILTYYSDINIGIKCQNQNIINSVNNQEINKLTLSLYQNKNDKELSLKMISVYDFSEWLELFYFAPFNLIGNSLNELKENPISFQLSFDLYNNLPNKALIDNALKQKKSPIKVSKSLNELLNFKANDNSKKVIEIAKEIFNNKEFIKNLQKLDISKLARFLSDIYSIQGMQEISINILKLNTINYYVTQISSLEIYEITQILNNIRKVSHGISIEILQELNNTNVFEQKFLNANTNDIHELKHLYKSFKIKEHNSTKNLHTTSIINSISKENDLTKISKIISSIKDEKIIKTLFESKKLSIEYFIYVAKNNEFRFSHLMQIFPELVKADFNLTYKLFVSLPYPYFIKLANRTNIYGISQTLLSLKKIDDTYLKKSKTISTKTKFIFKELCENKTSNFLKYISEANITAFLDSYHKFWNVDKELTNIYIEPILKERAKNKSIDKVELSSFSQGINRVSSLNNNCKKYAELIYYKHSKQLKIISENLNIRQISYGLQQLSILEEETDNFANEIREIIIKKASTERNREDFTSGVLPELKKALTGKNGKLIIKQIENETIQNNER